MKITLVDYGAGNLPSVERALQRLGAESQRGSSANEISEATALVLPGVGHYAALIRALEKDGLRAALLGALERGIPFLGICLGLQALYQTSDEAPDLQGLNLLPGRVAALSGAVKLPHMGWNQLESRGSSRLLSQVDAEAYFYFAHSYAVLLSANGAESSSTAATCKYGGEFVAVTERQNLFAVQFHPEKSGQAGQRVLHNFLRIAAS